MLILFLLEDKKSTRKHEHGNSVLQCDKYNKINQSLLWLAFNSRNSLDVRFQINALYM